MKLHKLVLTLSLGMTLAAQAKNLDSYRAQSTKLKEEGRANAEVQKTVEALRAKLGTSSIQWNPELLKFNLAKISTPTRVSYNTYFKNILQQTLTTLAQEEKYQAPVAIDDTVSMENLVKAKEVIKRANCMAGFLGTGEKKQSIDTFLDSFLALIRDSQSKKIDGSAASPETAAAFLKLLTPEIGRIGVTDLLGNVTGVQVTDGAVKEILFLKKDPSNPNKKPLQLTLSMMITARTGEDTSYLQAQKCLLDFLEEQSAVLQMRVQLMNDRNRSDKMDMYKTRFDKIVQNIQEFEMGYDPSPAGKQRGLEMAEEWKAKQVKKDPRAQYFQMLALYYEGRTFSNNVAEGKKIAEKSNRDENNKGFFAGMADKFRQGGAFVENVARDYSDEREFIKSRLDRVHGVLELMTGKYKESREVHDLLAKMKISQVNQWIDLLLQLRGNDIATDYDFTEVSEQMFKASIANQAGLDADVNVASADNINYGLQYKQISQLGRTLDEEKMLREQRQIEIKQITTQPRP